ncbi:MULTISPECIES: esterase-like activity of phytase family protein [Polaromonas]|uniref:Esterase-like activity of phytase family protein n=1 Tax=Polaromonas aquatica TaxID=332657 RepID=A0ABW1TUN8_9BURK
MPPAPNTGAALTRRQLLLATGASAMLGLTGCAPTTPVTATPAVPASPPSARLRLIGEARLPSRLQFQGTTVGGLSGIDYDPASGQYFLLSDDGSSRNPARFYTAKIPLDADHLGQPEITGVTSLRQADGSAYPAILRGREVLDPESIRWRAASQTLFWTSEGNALAGVAPSLSETRLDGTLLRKFALPAMFDFGLLQGPRSNLTFEGLTLTPDGNSAWISMEGPMLQDGPLPTVQAPGGPCRFTQIDLASGRALRQIAYIPDAIPHAPVPPATRADNGISEILMLDADRMLVLERAYMAGYGTDASNSLRLYLIDTRQGSDTLALPALQGAAYQPVNKLLLADFSAFIGPGTGRRLERLDNTEGMTWGPRLPNGNRSLVFISDDNFNTRQITQLLAFEFFD